MEENEDRKIIPKAFAQRNW